MLKLLTTLSRAGLSELVDLVGGRTLDGASVADVDADEGWYRPARVHALEDRRVLAVSIVPDFTSITRPEGSSVSITAELQGGTSGQSYDVTFNWRDGSSPTTVTVVAAADGTAPVSASHTYADNNNYTVGGGDPVTLTVVGESASANVNVFITNVAPTIALIGNTSVNEGSVYSLELGAVTDPGNDTVTSYRVNWGDGTSTGFLSGHPTGDTFTHTYADNASRTITVDLVDGDGTFLAAGSLTVTVNNVSPTVALSGNATVNEGATYTLNLGAVTDPGNDTETSYQIHWGDGTSSPVISGSPSGDVVTHVYTDNGPRTITVDITDEDGTHAAAGSLSLTVLNVAPTIALTGNATVDEGTSYTLNLGAITDPGTDSVTSYEIHWGDGTSSGIIAGSPASTTATHTYTDNGSRTITVDLIDEDGTHTSAGSLSITVLNVAPTIVLTGDATVDEGATYTLNLGAITNPGDDAITGYEIHWGDGTSSGVISGSPAGTTATHTYTDNGSRTITVDLIDEDDTHKDAGTLTITVLDVAPTIVLTGDPTVDEGATYTLTLGAVADPGNDTVTDYIVDWGDGSEPEEHSGSPVGDILTHTYADNGAYTITVSLVDEDGTHANAGSLSVSVLNVAPTIVLTGDANVDEGSPYTLNLGAVTDPGADVVSSYVIHWGDGHSDTVTGSPAGRTATHTYADQGSYTITVDLIDGDGTHADAGTLAISVDNVAPDVETVQIDGVTTSAVTITDGETITLDVTFFDPGLNDFTDGQTLVGAIDWGDGSPLGDVTISAVVGQPGRYTFTATHQYVLANPAVPETATIRLSISDGTATTTANAAVVTIAANAAPVVTITPVGPTTINEGGSVTLDVTFVDGGPGNQYDVTISWGDGSPDTTFTVVRRGGGTFTRSHTYADNGSYTVTVQVTDGGGQTGSDSVGITVNNVPPTIVLTGDATVAEGSLYTLDLGAVTDPGLDTVSGFIINWGDGASTGVIPGLPTGQATHIYADNGSYTITVDLIDEDGMHLAAGTHAVTVTNVAPTIALTGPVTVDEGALFLLDLGAVTDPGADTVTSYLIDWGVGAAPEPFSGHPTGQTASHVYGNNGVFVITVTLVDEDGSHVGAGTHVVTVNNVPPQVEPGSIVLPEINEGQTAELTFTFNDPGQGDTFTIAVDWGDGRGLVDVTADGTLTPNGAGSYTFRVASPQRYPQDGSFFVQFTVSDGSPGPVTGGSATLVVNDVAPVINPASIVLPEIDEGERATLEFSFSDPGLLDVYVILIDWGDGAGFIDMTTAGVLTSAIPGEYTFTVTSPTPFAQDAQYSVQMAVVDIAPPNAFGLAAATLRVNDIAATIVPAGPALATIHEGEGTLLEFEIVDPGLADVHVVQVDWGDGSLPQDVTVFGVPDGAGRIRFSLNSPAAYVQDGPYTVQITVQDTRATALPVVPVSLDLNVENVAPQVTSVSVTPSAINEGQAVTLVVTFFDPGLLDFNTSNPVDVTIDWGDGTTETMQQVTLTSLGSGLYSFTMNRVYADDGPTTGPIDNCVISFDFQDDDEGVVNSLTVPTVTVNNVPPVVSSALSPILVDSLGVATLNMQFTDPGILDNLTVVSIDWGGTGSFLPGGAPQITHLGGGVFALTAAFRYAVDPPPVAPGDSNPIPHFTVELVVQDKDGGEVRTALDANVPTGIARLQPEAPAPAPPLSTPQSVAQTIPADVQTSVVAAVESEAPSSSQSSVENTSAQVVLREVLPNGREKLLGTFDENALDTVLGKLRGLPDRHYRVYMVMPDGSERLIVDVVVRQGRPTDPDAGAREQSIPHQPPTDPQLQTDSETAPRSPDARDATSTGEEADGPVGGPSIEGDRSGSESPAALLPRADDEDGGQFVGAGPGDAAPLTDDQTATEFAAGPQLR